MCRVNGDTELGMLAAKRIWIENRRTHPYTFCSAVRLVCFNGNRAGEMGEDGNWLRGSPTRVDTEETGYWEGHRQSSILYVHHFFSFEILRQVLPSALH